MNKPKKPQCYNCKFSGDAFKVAGITHHHCHGPEYEAKDNAGEHISPWDTLREWWDTCEDHEFEFQPCGEGDNVCTCTSADQCGYVKLQQGLIESITKE